MIVVQEIMETFTFKGKFWKIKFCNVSVYSSGEDFRYLRNVLGSHLSSKLVTTLVLKYGTDVVSNPQTVVWPGLSESFVHNQALSFAHKHRCH